MTNILILQNLINAYVFNARLAQANLITKTDFHAKLSKSQSHMSQNYLVFQPINKYFKMITNTDYISSWTSKGLSAESIKPPATSDNSLAPSLDYYGNKIRVTFAGGCLKQSNKILYTYGKVVNIYIIYELGVSTSHSSDSTIKIVYLLQLL